MSSFVFPNQSNQVTQESNHHQYVPLQIPLYNSVWNELLPKKHEVTYGSRV